jgi:hypothetical protein
LSAILKILISEEQTARWIKDVLTYAKQTWTENAAIGNYVKQEGARENDVDKPPGTD